MDKVKYRDKGVGLVALGGGGVPREDERVNRRRLNAKRPLGSATKTPFSPLKMLDYITSNHIILYRIISYHIEFRC